MSEIFFTKFSKDVHSLAIDKGWWKGFTGSSDQVAARLALIHSEVSEALECLRQPPNDAFTKGRDGKPEGFITELADVVIRCMDLSEGLNLDLTSAILEKHEYNKTRPYRHGGKNL